MIFYEILLKFFFFPPLFLGFAHMYNTSKNFGGGRLKPPQASILATPLP